MTRQYHSQTAAETFDRIRACTTPWVAMGDFLDDWRRLPVAERPPLVAAPLADAGEDRERQRWAAFIAATVEWLCWNAKLPFPGWTNKPEYRLPEPWFLYPVSRLAAARLAARHHPRAVQNAQHLRRRPHAGSRVTGQDSPKASRPRSAHTTNNRPHSRGACQRIALSAQLTSARWKVTGSKYGPTHSRMSS